MKPVTRDIKKSWQIIQATICMYQASLIKYGSDHPAAAHWQSQLEALKAEAERLKEQVNG